MVMLAFAVFAIISIVAVAGNGLLIFLWLRLDGLLVLSCNIILRTPSLRTPSNLLVISLGMSDMLMVVKVAIFMVNLYHGGPFLGLLGAKVCEVFLKSLLVVLITPDIRCRVHYFRHVC
jgi:hypothetical protein